VSSVVAAEDPRVRGSDKYLVWPIGCGGERPDFFVAGSARRDIAPDAAAVVETASELLPRALPAWALWTEPA
jgi:hypothetical protein